MRPADAFKHSASSAVGYLSLNTTYTVLLTAVLGMVILAHRLFHVIRRREHAGPAPTFEHPAHLTAKEPQERAQEQGADTAREEAPGAGGSHGGRRGDAASG